MHGPAAILLRVGELRVFFFFSLAWCGRRGKEARLGLAAAVQQASTTLGSPSPGLGNFGPEAGERSWRRVCGLGEALLSS